MLLLNEQQMREVASCDYLIEGIEQALKIYKKGECLMAKRYMVEFDGNCMLYMPCIADGYIGSKISAEFPENPHKYGLPHINALALLNDASNGQLLAIMNGSALTALRTGAAGGMAMKYLSRRDSRNVGIIGCGVQGLNQLMFACNVRQIETAYLYDNAKIDYTSFIERIKQLIYPKSLNVVICNDVTELLKNSDIVITATTSREPVLPNDQELLRGKSYFAFGSWKPYMREIPDAIWDVVKYVYAESSHTSQESGDLSQPLESGILTMERIKMFDELLTDEKTDEELGDTRFFKSVGISVYDVITAKRIYERAISLGIGTEYQF
jgi:ornithine cyclodeaminase/alanine dehydrogenase-like protein (mu-crystallin family)